MRRALAPLLATFTFAACRGPSDAQKAGQLRFEGRTLAEWWLQRRNPDDEQASEARTAIRMMGPSAVPFLADKAASHDLGDAIGGSVALEDLCPNAVPAMEAARAAHPSPALEAAIRRVRAEAAQRVRSGTCDESGAPVRPEAGQ